jgi:transposase InsO family protein
MKFAFIHAEKASFPIAPMCRLLGVTRQGYYAYAGRPPPALRSAEVALSAEVARIHEESRRTYGSPRVLAKLRASGLRVSKKRVERSMRAQGLQARPRGRFRTTTKANLKHSAAPNLLNRQFAASRPNERWVTDITYVWTAEGWCYLAAILDLFSRRIVGWALDATLTTALPLRALDEAIRRRAPKPGLLHHSDRGCQYTSHDYRATLSDLGIQVSMSRKGNCWDNAVAESFFATLKTELVHERPWGSRVELRAAVFDYIEIFYNRQRLHSTLDYKTPDQVEKDHAAQFAA